MRRLPLRSPPRVRGKGGRFAGLAHRFGITPACAGKRRPGFRLIHANGDHPRVCGEKFMLPWLNALELGSPPRVRGKAADCGPGAPDSGITPACAGKSPSWRNQSAGNGDHPRVCGEKERQSQFNSGSMGSPPRVRGKVSYHMKGMAADRITPACAGKRGQEQVLVNTSQDHPRVCGEKGKEPGLIQKTEGSPPRVRGKAVQMGVRLVQPGITPAYAGKRAASAREAYFICGSPPRVRGKGQTGCEVVVELGITPAYAGKSISI